MHISRTTRFYFIKNVVSRWMIHNYITSGSNSVIWKVSWQLLKYSFLYLISYLSCDVTHKISIFNNYPIMWSKSINFLHFNSCKYNNKHNNNNNKNYKQYNNKHDNNNYKNCVSSEILSDGIRGCSTLQKTLIVRLVYVF